MKSDCIHNDYIVIIFQRSKKVHVSDSVSSWEFCGTLILIRSMEEAQILITALYNDVMHFIVAMEEGQT